jgi:hypothetical protein
MQVQKTTLEQMLEVENTAATPFEIFDLVFEDFDKATVHSANKVFGDLISPHLFWSNSRTSSKQCKPLFWTSGIQ